MLSYKLLIFGSTWIVNFLTKRDFVRQYGENILGITECDDRTIYFRTDKIHPTTIAHEIAHAYFDESSTAVLELSAEQTEELACEIISKHGRKIIEQSDQVLHAYKVLKGRRVK